jgi:PAS domain S-box-containing protein
LVSVPGPLESLVESSDVPLAVLELPSGRVVAANDEMAQLLGVTCEVLVNTTATPDLLVPEERRHAQQLLQALAAGTLTGYQAVRNFSAPGGAANELSVGLCAVDLDGGRVALFWAFPLQGGDGLHGGVTAAMNGPTLGRVMLGTLDREWRIDRVSYDIVEMLGYQPEEVAGTPILGLLQPADAQAFLVAVSHARIGRRTVRVTLRVRAKSGAWVPLTVVLAALSDDYPPALAFAFVLPTGETEGRDKASKEEKLDADLQGLIRDVHVSGMVHRLDRLPDTTRFPALSRLTTREWEILVMLLEGERVAAIAEDLYVSQSTVRNHLSSIFSKVGVHSQAELIRRLRTG